MFIKRNYLDLIASGRKTLEVRLGNLPGIRNYRPGDLISIGPSSPPVLVKIRAIRTYSSFEEMASHEDVQRIVPGLSQASVLAALRNIWPDDKVRRFGVFVLDIRLET
jgi:ASC-1-like (ASCH) protein